MSRDSLLAAAISTGGWPYAEGRTARLEPTAWALLALGPDTTIDRAAFNPALAFLTVMQRGTGFVIDPGAPTPNYAWNALVLLALQSLGDPSSGLRLAPMVDALIAAKGVSIEGDPDVMSQNGRLQAWSWIDGTFSWIEPTAWCLLALKRRRATGAAAAARIAEAEAVLIDRVCDPGGWNYGNAAVLGQDLRPYVPTSALGLLAMQDRREQPAVVRSLAWLEAHATSEPSTMALALSAIALRVFDRPIDRVLARLTALNAAPRVLASPHLDAMALYASTIGAHHAAAFTIA